MILSQIDMHRLYCPSQNILSNTIIIDNKEQVHHVKNVLRIKPLELVAVFDNQGNEYIASVIEIGADAIKLEVKERKPLKDSGIKITLACAIPKKVKMDDIVDKLTQLGVECIIPLETERVIVRLDKQKKIERCQRWKKIALSAAKQSQGNKLPVVKPVSELKDVILAAHNFDLKLIPTLEGKRKCLRKVFKDRAKKIEKVMILIGPEGDFTQAEITQALEAGFLAVTLGDRVLRVDTAAIAVVSFIKLNENH